MININEVKELVDYIANKHQTGAQQSPNEFNLCAASSMDDVVLYYYGLPQYYSPGNTLPPVAWEVTQLTMDYLRDIKATVTLPVTTAGRMAIPADYIHKSSLTFDYVTQSTTGDPCAEDEPVNCATEEQTAKAKTYMQLHASTNVVTRDTCPVVILGDEQFQSMRNSEVRKPSKKYPIARVMNGYFELLPKNLGTVTLTYIRFPLKPVWGYTLPNLVDPVYNPVTSTDFELPPILKNQVVYCILTKLGINIREEQLQIFAQTMKKEGV